MSALRNLPIARKFACAFGIVCGLSVLLGTYTFLTLRGISQRSSDISDNAFPSVNALAEVRGNLNILRREDLDLLLCQTPSCSAAHTAKREQAIAGYNAALKTYEPYIRDAGERQYHEKMAASMTQYLDVSNRSVSLLAAGKTGDALDLLMADSTVAEINAALSAASDDLTLNSETGMKESRAVTQASSRATWLNAAITLLIVALSALVGVVLTRLIAPPLQAATAALERLAEKDLTISVEEIGHDEIGRLSVALNSSVASIRAVLQSFAKGAETLSAATTEISTRSVESAGNAHTQSSKTNQIAAAAQEMTATIGEISHNAESAAGASRESAETASQGGAVMQAAASTMEKIAAATCTVSDKMTSLARCSEEIGKVGQRDSGDQ